MCVSCCSVRPITTERVAQDSVRIETRERVVYRDTVVTITIPGEHLERETRDTVSELRAENAQSLAKVEGGRLFHSLTVRPLLRPVSLAIPEIRRDSVRIIHSRETKVEVIERGGFWHSRVAKVLVFVGLFYLLKVIYKFFL